MSQKLKRRPESTLGKDRVSALGCVEQARAQDAGGRPWLSGWAAPGFRGRQTPFRRVTFGMIKDEEDRRDGSPVIRSGVAARTPRLPGLSLKHLPFGRKLGEASCAALPASPDGMFPRPVCSQAVWPW